MASPATYRSLRPWLRNLTEDSMIVSVRQNDPTPAELDFLGPGAVWYNKTSNEFKSWDGTSVLSGLGGGGGGGGGGGAASGEMVSKYFDLSSSFVPDGSDINPITGETTPYLKVDTGTPHVFFDAGDLTEGEGYIFVTVPLSLPDIAIDPVLNQLELHIKGRFLRQSGLNEVSVSAETDLQFSGPAGSNHGLSSFDYEGAAGIIEEADIATITVINADRLEAIHSLSVKLEAEAPSHDFEIHSVWVEYELK